MDSSAVVAVPDEARMAAALQMAQRAYETDHVRLTGHGFGNRSTLVSSRQGVFAVSRVDFVPLIHGLFYGMALRDGAIYLFESCDAPANPTRLGRIIRLQIDGDRIGEVEVLAKGLENGCHQIDFIGGRLCVLDTYNQRVLRFKEDFSSFEVLYPLPRVADRDWAKGYVHCNSLLAIDDRILLLLHNGRVRPSEVAVLDTDWREVARFVLPGNACHNLALLQDGTLLACGSMAGQLIDRFGPVAQITTTQMTRGLCVGAEEIAVGASKFSMRRRRNFAPGSVTFLDRQYRWVASVELPAAPTEVRRLTGLDLGQSSNTVELSRPAWLAQL